MAFICAGWTSRPMLLEPVDPDLSSHLGLNVTKEPLLPDCDLSSLRTAVFSTPRGSACAAWTSTWSSSHVRSRLSWLRRSRAPSHLTSRGLWHTLKKRRNESASSTSSLHQSHTELNSTNGTWKHPVIYWHGFHFGWKINTTHQNNTRSSLCAKKVVIFFYICIFRRKKRSHWFHVGKKVLH